MKGYCIECRCETECTLKPIRYKQYTITGAFCTQCGAEMNPHGLIDRNVQEIEKQRKH